VQVYLRLNFFRGGASEKFVTLFQTNFLVYGKNIDEERECFLLVTTSYLYILNQQKKTN